MSLFTARGLRTCTLLTCAALAATSLPAAAQRAAIPSPGGYGDGLGQTTRFDNEFNPAISFVVDVIADYFDVSGEADGLDIQLRRIDLLIADWIDPNAYAWVTIAYEEEGLVLDEAAIEYIGLPGRNTMRFGRFFVDFGKQTQAHIEELRTIERPLVLRDFLGEELFGEGAQWDYWHPAGEASIVRFSLGAFGDLSGAGHGVEGDGLESQTLVPERKKPGQLNFSVRTTALTEIGDHGTLQVGGSGRFIPEFAFEYNPNDLYQDGMSNSVFGIDGTYGWHDDQGVKSFTTGFEYLWNSGDLEGEIDDMGTDDSTDDTMEIINGTRTGYYAFADYGWTQFDSAGVQYSRREAAHADGPERGELDLYYTRHLSEILRLRVGVTFASDEEGPDATRAAVQLTSFVGPHGHGLNW
jgi:hypothetical protein